MTFFLHCYGVYKLEALYKESRYPSASYPIEEFAKFNNQDGATVNAVRFNNKRQRDTVEQNRPSEA